MLQGEIVKELEDTGADPEVEEGGGRDTDIE